MNYIEADQILEEIKNIEKYIEEINETAKSKINKINEILQMKIDKSNDEIQKKKMVLMSYYKMCPHEFKDTKTQASKNLLSGKLVYKKPNKKIIKCGDNELIKFLKNKSPQYIEKVEIEKPLYSEFKKTLKIYEDSIVDQNGEIIDTEALKIEEIPERIEIQ